MKERPLRFAISSRADVWSFGIFLWEIGTGHYRKPYQEYASHHIWSLLRAGHTLPVYDLPDALKDVVRDCWALDPSSRLRTLHIVSVGRRVRLLRCWPQALDGSGERPLDSIAGADEEGVLSHDLGAVARCALMGWSVGNKPTRYE